MKCENCQNEIEASAKFCKFCGRLENPMVRSKNEINAMIKMVEASVRVKTVPGLAVYMTLLSALNWCAGADSPTPMTLIENLKKSENGGE